MKYSMKFTLKNYGVGSSFPTIQVYSIRIGEVIFRVVSKEGGELVLKIVAGILENEEIMLDKLWGYLENNVSPMHLILSDLANDLFDFNIGRTHVFGGFNGTSDPSITHHVPAFLIRDWSSTNPHLLT